MSRFWPLAVFAVTLALAGCAGVAGGGSAGSSRAHLLLRVPAAEAAATVRAQLADQPQFVVEADSAGGLVVRERAVGSVSHVRFVPVADDVTRLGVASRHPWATGGTPVTPAMRLLQFLDRGSVRAVLEPMDPSCAAGSEWLRLVRQPRPEPTASTQTGEPEVVGGMMSVAQSIQYPPSARQAGIQGVAYVGLVVEPDGSVRCMAPAVAIHPLLTEEALRVARGVRFRPAPTGERRRWAYVLPITFQLR